MKRIALLIILGLSTNCHASVLEHKYTGSKCEMHEGTEFLANCYFNMEVQLPEKFKAIMCSGEVRLRIKKEDGGLMWIHEYGFLSNNRFGNHEEITIKPTDPPMKFMSALVNFPKDWRVTEIKYLWSKCELGDQYYDL